MTTSTRTSCKRLNSLRPFCDEFRVFDPILRDHREGRPLAHAEVALSALRPEFFAANSSSKVRQLRSVLVSLWLRSWPNSHLLYAFFQPTSVVSGLDRIFDAHAEVVVAGAAAVAALAGPRSTPPPGIVRP